MSEKVVHIVIGSGAGGSLCAKELTKSGKVLLFETGTVPNDDITSNPLNWGTSFSTGAFTNYFQTISQSSVHNRNILCPSGRSIGGTTNINAMIWTGGHPQVFDQYWPKKWNSKRFSRLLKRVKSIIQPRQIFASQPLSKTINRSNNNRTVDYNSVWCHSISQDYHYLTISSSNHRLSLYHHILEPLIRNHRIELYSNVTVETIVLQIRTDSNHSTQRRYRALGVIGMNHVEGKREYFTSRNGGEIILCGGAIQSPYLLSRSVILPCDYSLNLTHDCHRHEQLIQDITSSSSNFSYFSLPDIGTRLLDHTILPFIGIGNWWNPSIQSNLRKSNYWHNVPNESSNGYPPNSVHGWIFLNKDGEICSNSETIPSVQLVFVDGRILCGSLLPEMILPHYSSASWYENSLRPYLFKVLQMITAIGFIQWLLSCVCGVLICCVQPTTKPGHISLPNSSTPSTRASTFNSKDVKIDLQYGTSSEDILVLWKSMKYTRQLFSSSTSLHFLELLPGPLFLYCFNLTLFTFFYRQFVGSYFHYCGTNFMSSSPPSSQDKSQDQSSSSFTVSGVVNEELQVHSVESLRIADASVIPAIPSAPIAAIVMSIGLSAGELVNDSLIQKPSPK